MYLTNVAPRSLRTVSLAFLVALYSSPNRYSMVPGANLLRKQDFPVASVIWVLSDEFYTKAHDCFQMCYFHSACARMQSANRYPQNLVKTFGHQ